MPNLTSKQSPTLPRLVWDYKNASVSSIQKVFNVIDWSKLFSNANVEKQVNILNDTLQFNFSSFVRSKVITVDDRFALDKLRD